MQPTPFRPLIMESGVAFNGIGEVPGTMEPIVGKPPPVWGTGQHFCGEREWFSTGKAFVGPGPNNLPRNSQGMVTCCMDGFFGDAEEQISGDGYAGVGQAGGGIEVGGDGYAGVMTGAGGLEIDGDGYPPGPVVTACCAEGTPRTLTLTILTTDSCSCLVGGVYTLTYDEDAGGWLTEPLCEEERPLLWRCLRPTLPGWGLGFQGLTTSLVLDFGEFCEDGVIEGICTPSRDWCTSFTYRVEVP